MRSSLIVVFAGKSVTTLEVAQRILQQAVSGERDLDRLKGSAFKKLELARYRRVNPRSIPCFAKAVLRF